MPRPAVLSTAILLSAALLRAEPLPVKRDFSALLTESPQTENQDQTSSPSSSSTEPDYNEAADENHDGHVSKREARRYRREVRRAQRRAQGLAEEEEEPEEISEAEEEKRENKRRRALGRASRMAQDMKDSLPQDEGGDVGSGSGSGSGGGSHGSGGGSGKGSSTAKALSGDGRSASLASAAPAGTALKGGGGVAVAPRSFTAAPGGAPGALSASPSGDPAHPSSASDYLLAVRGGYAPALGKAGLKLSADGKTILRQDGSPATDEDYARLGSAIREMPAALAQRPDFFARVSPSHYSDLKAGFTENRPGVNETVFKHVETTEENRDFVHSKSCEKLSGECNKDADKSYKKGDFVDPKDLDKMWASLEAELSAQGEEADKERRGSGEPGRPEPGASASAAPSDEPALEPWDRPHEAAQAAKKAEAAPASAPAAAAAAALGAAKKAWTGLVAAVGGGKAGAQGGSSSALALVVGGVGVAAVAAWTLLRRRSDDEDPS